MITALILAAAVGSTPDRRPSAYKLVIAYYQSTPAVVDYPTLARCEAARDAFNAEMQKRVAASGIPQRAGGDVAFCIPG